MVPLYDHLCRGSLGVRESIIVQMLDKAGTYHDVLLGCLVGNEEQHRRLWTMIHSKDELQSWDFPKCFT